MKLNKHILILTPGFAASEDDSTCIPPLQLYVRDAEHQTELDMTVLAVHYPNNTEPYQFHKSKVYPIGGNNKKWFTKFTYQGKIINTVKKINAEKKIDLIHSFWLGECALLGQKEARRYKVPHVCTAMGQDSLKKNKYMHLLNTKNFTVVAQSAYQQQQLGSYHKVKSNAIIPWGIDHRSTEYLPSHRSYDILGVGSLIPLKNYKVFVETVAQLQKEKPDLSAVLIGEGPQMDELKKLAEKYKLGYHLEFKGEMERDDVIEIMKHSKVLLHPSNQESLGYVFLEAMQAGMIIISKQVGIAEEGPYWGIAKEDSQFTNLVRRALEHEMEEYTARQPYTMRDTIKQYHDLYSRLIES